MSELNIKETGSGSSAKGMAFGLEGDLFMYLIAGGVLSLILLVFLIKLKLSLAITIPISIIPLVLAIIYLVIFRINKPPGYQHDLIDQALNGDSLLMVRPTNQPHPLNYTPKEDKK